VAHVTLGLSTGGQERLLVDFARSTDTTQFQLVFISLTGRGPIADALEMVGARVVCLDAKPGLRPSLVLRLKKLFERENVDIVHTHDDRPLIYGVPAARWAGLRVIHTQHHGRLPNARRRQEMLIRWTGRWANAFVTVSRDSADYYLRCGLPKTRVSTIWNGIDTAGFSYSGPMPGGSAVTVARLSPEKNIPNLLRAAAIVRDADPEFRLEIAGDGPCREDLVKLAYELNLGNTVKFLGEVRDIPTLLARSSLFVLPSRSEGISLTLLEAMARGLPVAATRVGGNPEVVLDGHTGLLVPSDDASALAEAILSIRRRPDEALQMGLAGRRRVEAAFDVHAMVEQYERLYLGEPLQPSPSAVTV
jgi:glycosyltransferase involved in cell wall biosynthesis